MIRELNAKGRCAGVPLVGADNIVGTNQVCAWQSGVPLRTSFATGAPDHDPARWSMAATRRRRVDCLVWISSFGPQPLPERHPPDHRPGPARAIRCPSDAAVVIPVGTPGLDHAGSVYRMDGVVSLPLRAAARHGPAQRRRQSLARIRAPALEAAMTTRLAGGRVYDPLNGIDGRVMDLWIARRPDRRRRRRTARPTRWSISPARWCCRAASTCTAISAAARSTSPG